MNRNFRRTLLPLFDRLVRATASLVMALVALPGLQAVSQESPQNVDKDRRFNAVAWMQNAAEYKVMTTQIYRLAILQLDKGLDDPTWTADEEQWAAGDFHSKQPAVILDVDETVLDNSAFNARNILERQRFTEESWNAWCLEERAELVPGVKAFIDAAQARDVKVFYITNRDDIALQATINNLLRLGLPACETTVLTRNEEAGRGDDKRSRRAMVAKEHRIVLLIGDSLSDICYGMDTRDQAERQKIA
ncbi:MAG TPA: HAD family acid phosphatase, partial [Pirellulaceae bacterium]|nr:HAD family acid phosphatase [Pirellulaceae bacterium]